MSQPAATPVAAPSIRRRLAALPYEGLLVLALVLIAAFPLAGLKGVVLQGIPHLLMQIYFFTITGIYFTWFWRHGGQTLAMKTWRFRVTDNKSAPLGLMRAIVRYVLVMCFYGPACVGLVLLFFPSRVSPLIAMWTFLPMASTILWAKFDADGQFLHDRLAGTRLTSMPV
ncbi:MAG: RDD family protein [Betaproteobacteria bacterium]|nr:RDD family protein [Betaproteobacteria bacterium]